MVLSSPSFPLSWGTIPRHAHQHRLRAQSLRQEVNWEVLGCGDPPHIGLAVGLALLGEQGLASWG